MKRWLVGCCCVLLPLMQARAAVLVQWGVAAGDTGIVSGVQFMSEGAGGQGGSPPATAPTNYTGDSTLNLAVPSSPPVSATYYSNNTGRTPIFYAAVQKGSNAITNFRINNNTLWPAAPTNADTIKISSSRGAAESHTCIAVVVWTKTGSGFLNGGDTGTAALDSLAMSIKPNAGPLGGSGGVRWVVRLGSSFYISETLNASNAGAAYGAGIKNFASVLTQLTAMAWSAYDPETDITVIGAPASPGSFNNLTAVGFHWRIDGPTNATQEIDLGYFAAEGAISGGCTDPTELSMSGTGVFCSADGARVFGVDGATETNVIYELRRDGSMLEAVTGTAASIAFTAQSATGAYTVVGVRGACETVMLGSGVIRAPATVNAGPDQTVGRGSTIALAGAVGGGATGGQWSGGAGTFAPSTNALNATYQASLAEKLAGTVTLTLTTVGQDPCSPESDNVTITLTNSAPVAHDQTVNAATNTPTPITLTASDADGDALTYIVVDLPANGTLTGAAPNVVYTSAGSFTGVVTFTFKANDGTADSAPATVTVIVAASPPPSPSTNPAAGRLGGRDQRFYFIGNSLSRGLSLASGQDRARLETLFRLRGHRMIFGTQLGAGVNLDEHWTKLRLTVPVPTALQLTHMDDWGETSTTNETFGSAIFRDYHFAFQGNQRAANGVISTGHLFDAIVLQPYQSLLEHNHYTAADQAKAQRGDRSAVSNFVRYAIGNSPSNSHRVTRTIYIYSAWPRLEGIEAQALDPDGDGVYSFAEFFDQSFSPPVNPLTATAENRLVPSRDYVNQLYHAAKADHPGEIIRLIPVGEVFAHVDGLIRSNNLPGVSNYFARNAAYYLDARLDGTSNLAAAGFTFIYPPGMPAAFASDFIAAQGVKNFYCDRVHMNDQTHNDVRSGTIGAYLSAATVYACLTGERPDVHSAADVAGAYEKFDAAEDGALIAALQQAIWDVVSSTNWRGVNYAERTGLRNLSDAALDYNRYVEAYFDPVDRTNALVAGIHADPDGDGLSNLEEFFRQSNPTNPSPANPMAIRRTAGGAEVEFAGLSRARGLLPRLEWTTNLVAAWQPFDLRALPSMTGEVAGVSVWRYAPPAGESRSFYRYTLAHTPIESVMPIVAWGPSLDTVGGNLNLVAGNGSISLNLGTPANPAVGGSYSNSSPVFYSAAATLVAGNTISAYRITDGGTNSDMMQVTFGLGTGTNNQGVWSVVWLKDGAGGANGFLNGANTNATAFAGARVRARVNAATTGVSEMRIVIRLGSQWYISDDRGAVTATVLFEEIALANPHAAQWFVFDPSNIEAIGSPVQLDSFGDVSAVGFNWRSYITGTTATLQVESFTAESYTP